MSRATAFKRLGFPILKSLQIDTLFRYLNREKILILAYHGITKKRFKIQPWTLIPLDSFEHQIQYISQRYNVITLQKVVEAIMTGRDLPHNSAVITFDDGYKNNLTLAFPILKKYGIPATIFLTAGYISTDKILPLDEAYLIITHSRNRGPFILSEIGLGPLYFDTDEALLESYLKTVSVLKRFPTKEQEKYLGILRKALGRDYNESSITEDFHLLSWEEIKALLKTGLIQIGAHTVSHEILTNLPLENACEEIINSKSLIKNNLGQEVNLFAYPNGTEADYNEGHIEYLKDNAFICSVTTTARLNEVHNNLYRLGRICIGPNFTGNINHFALLISGFISALKSLGNHNHV